MRYAIAATMAALLLGLALVAAPAPAHAKANERTAQYRAAARAEAVKRAGPTREERYVARQTKLYSARYGRAVGRWVGLARRVGWTKSQLPTLMKVIYRESRGNPNARSASGYYVGLVQFGRHWVKGRDWRTDPKESLQRCLNSVNAVGWVHWPTAN